MSRRWPRSSASRSRPPARSIVRQRYPATGAANARVELLVAELASDTLLPLDLGADHDIYLPRVDWFPDSRSIAVQRQSRDQKTLELLRVDATHWPQPRCCSPSAASTGCRCTASSPSCRSTQQFIWASSRDGFQHLYLYGNDGKLIRPLTQGEFMVVGAPAEPAVRARGRARAARCISRPTCPRRSSGSCSGCRWTRRASRSG